MTAFFIAFLLGTMALPAAASPCDTLANRADTLLDESNYEALLAEAREARHCYDDLRQPRARQVLIHEGLALLNLDRYEEALAFYERYEKFLADADDLDVRRDFHQHRGYVRYVLGDLAGAASDYSSALHHAAGLPLLRQVRLTRDVGAVFQRIQDFEAAQRYYIRAEKLLEQVDERGTEYWETYARLLNTRADLLLQHGRPGPAISLLQQSLRLQPAEALQELAETHVLLGNAYRIDESFLEGARHLQQARRLAEQADIPHQAFRATHLLGWLYAQADEAERSERYLLEAYDQQEHARHDGYRRVLLEHLGRFNEREERFEEAIRYYREAVEVTEAYRASLRATGWSTAAFEAWIQPYRGLARVKLAQGQVQHAFEALEQARARHLRDLRTQARLVDMIGDSLRTRYDSLSAELSEVHSQLLTASSTPAERTRFTSEAARLSTERSRLLELPDFEVPHAEALQETLAEERRALISYLLPGTSPEARSTAHAFVLTPDTLAAVPLDASRDSVRALLGRVSPLLTGEPGPREPGDTRFDLTALHDLYDLLVAPIAPYLPEEGTPLTFVPDGPLFHVPFGALVEAPVAADDYHRAGYLIRRYPVGHLTAASLLLDPPAERRAKSHDLVAFARSSFSGSSAPDNTRFATDSLRLGDLPAAAQEARAVTGLFRRAKLWIDEDATKSTLADVAPEARIVHVATHAVASDDRSAIYLSGDGPDDEALTLEELRGRSLSAELVVLSACNTALGPPDASEGMLSFQHAVRALGVSSTLSTLWLVDDASTVPLMTRFYEALRDGASKEVALQQAQLAYLESAPAPAMSPYFWAAPVLYGDPAPVSLSPPVPYLRYALGALALLLFVGFLMFRRRR